MLGPLFRCLVEPIPPWSRLWNPKPHTPREPELQTGTSNNTKFSPLLLVRTVQGDVGGNAFFERKIAEPDLLYLDMANIFTQQFDEERSAELVAPSCRVR